MTTLWFFIIPIVHLVFAEDDGSYSYHKFSGPVSGNIREVVVPRRYPNQGYTLDYVATPDYLYSYGVEDPLNLNRQIHRETRNGDNVQGEYKVLQPDGLVRIVKYSADGTNGFTATVRYVKL
ncbi:cuticle protein 8-like [Zophobas morio]|uniref:cuticle protein 8-like n=1 Tax=Zophobas morio TaxID=2755281 RepID=UPI003082DBDA